MSATVIRVFEGEPLPDGCTTERLLSTEDIPWGTGTATRRLYTLLVTDTRYWLTDVEKRAQPLGTAR